MFESETGEILCFVCLNGTGYPGLFCDEHGKEFHEAQETKNKEKLDRIYALWNLAVTRQNSQIQLDANPCAFEMNP